MGDTRSIAYEDLILRRDHAQWPRERNPDAWANYRTEMIDAVPWFRSSQGGVWMSHKDSPDGHFVQGLLIAGHSGDRSYIDAEVVITSLNGERDDTPFTNVTQDRRNAMINTINAGRLVGIIFERGTTKSRTRTKPDGTSVSMPALLPCDDMPVDGEHGQNCWVAEYFLPTHMWPVRLPPDHRNRTGFVWMVRLEKHNLASQSWWGNADHGPLPDVATRDFSMTIPEEICRHCARTSPRIFQETFVCANTDCASCWYSGGNLVTMDLDLNYTDNFLKSRVPRPLAHDIYPTGDAEIVPNFRAWWNANYQDLIQRGEAIDSNNFQKRMNDLLAGFRCPGCGMLNRRVRWHQWHCRNKQCRFLRTGCPPIISVQMVTSVRGRVKKQPSLYEHPAFQRSHETPEFTVDEFELGPECYVAYLRPKASNPSVIGTSDRFFLEMQSLARTAEIPLERRWMANLKGGPGLTSHFAYNYGKEYIFSANVPTTPFESAPTIVQEALQKVNSWIAPWHQQESEPPSNEMYIAGYWEGQKMNWHDDGEVGLGNIIVTYTLGGSGRFCLRSKHKYHTGKLSRNYLNEDVVLSGCMAEDQRRALKARLDNGEISQEEWKAMFASLMDKAPSRKHSTMLDVAVHHGEIIIMYGNNTQRVLEHCADVTTPMRFALTFRYIKDDHKSLSRAREGIRAAYDVKFDPDDKWGGPQNLSPVNSREGSVGDPLPALSPRDPPPEDDEPIDRKRKFDELAGDDDKNEDDDNDDSSEGVRPHLGRAASFTTSAMSGVEQTGPSQQVRTARRATRGRTSARGAGRGGDRGRGSGRARGSGTRSAVQIPNDVQMGGTDDQSSTSPTVILRRSTRTSKKR